MTPAGYITSYIDVAQLTLYGFWIFFAFLVLYLLRENKREGYPLVAPDRVGSRVTVEGFPPTPTKKAFLMRDGTQVLVPRDETREPINAIPVSKGPGSALIPTGEPLLAGIGPGAWANRADVPDHAWDDQLPKIVPLRSAPAFFLAWEDTDLRGFAVVGADYVEAGTVVDVWLDRSEVVIRYLEVQLALPNATHHVLVPMNFLEIKAPTRRIYVEFILGAQFALVPATKHPEQVTLLEEDKIMAFYSAGGLYAAPGRADSLL